MRHTTARADTEVRSLLADVREQCLEQGRPTGSKQWLEDVLSGLGYSNDNENCLFMSLSIVSFEEGELNSESFYCRNFALLEDVVMMLERQGLASRRQLGERFGDLTVEVSWVEATRLGFELVAVCNYVPAMNVNSRRWVRGARMTRSAVNRAIAENAKRTKGQ